MCLLVSGSHPATNLYAGSGMYSSARSNASTTRPLSYKVVAVKDGDTFVLLMKGKEQVVRLAHVDCPEKKQPFGARAQEFASKQSFGKYVRLKHDHQYDRNHRLIADIVLADGRSLNKELIKNGLAWHFKKYSKDEVYATLETKARQQRVGLWKDRDPVAPWEWRRSRHSSVSEQ